MRPSNPPLITDEAIQTRVAELATELSAHFEGREPVIVSVLKGAVPFTADLAFRMCVPLRVEYIRARSYAGTQSRGEVLIEAMPKTPLAGKHLLLVEDILDTGRTASAVLDYLRGQDPASITICTLLDKPSRRETDVHADFVGFTIEDRFVVGYGLDHDERYRELPAIHVLDEDAE